MDIGCTYLCIKRLKKSKKTFSLHIIAMLTCCLIKLILYKNSDSIYLMKYTFSNNCSLNHDNRLMYNIFSFAMTHI